MLGKRMKRSRVREQRKIIVSGIINDHVTLTTPPPTCEQFLPLSSPKRSLFYKTARARNFSVTFCVIFNSRHFSREGAEVCDELGWFEREKSLEERRTHQNGYVSLRFAVYRENKSRSERKLSTLRQESSCIHLRRRLSFYRDLDSNGTFTSVNWIVDRTWESCWYIDDGYGPLY